MVVIGGDGSSNGEKKDKENLLLFRHDQNNSEKQWIPLDTVDISGPINIARFAQNAAPHHTLAVGARQVHILKIEAKSPWKVTPYKTIDQTKLREKCWVSVDVFGFRPSKCTVTAAYF